MAELAASWRAGGGESELASSEAAALYAERGGRSRCDSRGVGVDVRFYLIFPKEEVADATSGP